MKQNNQNGMNTSIFQAIYTIQYSILSQSHLNNHTFLKLQIQPSLNNNFHTKSFRFHAFYLKCFGKPSFSCRIVRLNQLSHFESLWFYC